MTIHSICMIFILGVWTNIFFKIFLSAKSKHKECYCYISIYIFLFLFLLNFTSSLSFPLSSPIGKILSRRLNNRDREFSNILFSINPKMGSTQSKDTMYAANKSDTDNLPIATYKPYSSFRTDLTVLRYMWFAKIAGGTHQDKLESFYKNQASLYDSYRYRTR